MTYSEVISRNCSQFSPSWWPRYAYHYTDVINAVSILNSGYLYSRIQADNKGLMQNDNASRQVIDMTDSQATSYVRFYFRPLTPTQYHNEGYKHSDIRYCGDENANVPVPIFFLFDLEKLLLRSETRFSDHTQAGHGSTLQCGEEAFSQLPFSKIYSQGATTGDDWRYRHAEILYPKEYPINESLKFIFCRNECEKATFLNCLRETSSLAFYRYKDFVRVAKDDTFQRNGLFVDSVSLHGNTISFSFADAPDKRAYAYKYSQPRDGKYSLDVKATFLFEWKKGKKTVYTGSAAVIIDYLSPRTIAFYLRPNTENASSLRVTLRIGGQLLCLFEQSLSPYELV